MNKQQSTVMCDEDGDVIHGCWEYYHKNGQVAKRGSYFDGKEDGTFLFYYDNGQLAKKRDYDKGVAVGI